MAHEVRLLVLTAWHGLCTMAGGKQRSALTAGPNGGQASPGHAPPLRGSGYGPTGGILYRAEQARRKLAMMAVFWVAKAVQASQGHAVCPCTQAAQWPVPGHHGCGPRDGLDGALK